MSDRRAPAVTPLDAGRLRIVDAYGRSRVAYAATSGSRTWIFLDGHTYILEAGRQGTRRGSRHDDAAMLAAPMPATVVAIVVSVGQEVRRGDVLVRLEAMKMELPITAPRDGRVRSIACTVGELVQPGIPLIDLAPEQEPPAGKERA